MKIFHVGVDKYKEILIKFNPIIQRPLIKKARYFYLCYFNSIFSLLTEHSVAGETVEFSFDLTNVEFIQKIVEIYPILENGFFVFMIAGKDNILKELNPGRCCYRCYTPENVYHSERGQGRLYIRKIAENQVILTTFNLNLS